MMRLSEARPRPSRHWKIALCSLSTGSRRTPRSRAAPVTTSPATTSTSLLAKAISLPALIAASVGPQSERADQRRHDQLGRRMSRRPRSRPRVREELRLARWTEPALSSPASSAVATETSSGRWRRTCADKRSRLRPAAIATTRKRSGKRLTTSSVVTPTEPVEPRIAIVFSLPLELQCAASSVIRRRKRPSAISGK